MAKLSEKEVQKGKKAVDRDAAAAERESRPSRNRGVVTGLRIWEFQNKTLLENVKAKLTDEELAAKWREEFPRAMQFGPKMVQTVRSLFNKGKHKNDEPAKPLVGYDETGAPQPAPTRGRKKADADDDAEEEAAPVKKAAPAKLKIAKK